MPEDYQKYTKDSGKIKIGNTEQKKKWAMVTSTESSWWNSQEQPTGTQSLYSTRARMESVVAGREALLPADTTAMRLTS